MRKLISILGLLSLSVALLAQGAGTPSTLRVRTDANNSLVITGAAQVNPVTSGVFSNRILRTDAAGNLQAVVTGGVISGQIQAPVTPVDCSAPSYSFAGDTNTGVGYGAAPDNFRLCAGGVVAGNIASTTTTLFTDLVIPAANTYFFSGRGGIASSADGILLLRNNANTDFTRLQLGGTTNSFPAIARSGVNIFFQRADGSANTSVSAATLAATDTQITNGSGTGIAVSAQSGNLNDSIYKVTIDRTAFVCAALTCDITIATVPAKTRIMSVYGDLTQVFACSATCTSSTLSLTLGTSAGATNIFLSFDADAALLQRGLVDADLGANMTRAAMIQGGYLPAWASTTPLSLRLTSGTGNIGNGSATNLSTGNITFYVHTARMP